MANYRVSIDISEKKLRLYDDQKLVKTYPVGVGKMVSKTPTGDYLIINKEPDPGGPYGAHWLGLSKKHYGIHGTNQPSSIGKMVSKGCIRMHNKDVIELANTVPLGTHVSIRP